MMALGVYLANSKNDPTYEKAGALIENMRQAIIRNAGALSPRARTLAIEHGNELLNTVRENLRALRGEGGAVN